MVDIVSYLYWLQAKISFDFQLDLSWKVEIATLKLELVFLIYRCKVNRLSVKCFGIWLFNRLYIINNHFNLISCAFFHFKCNKFDELSLVCLANEGQSMSYRLLEISDTLRVFVVRLLMNILSGSYYCRLTVRGSSIGSIYCFILF